MIERRCNVISITSRYNVCRHSVLRVWSSIEPRVYSSIDKTARFVCMEALITDCWFSNYLHWTRACIRERELRRKSRLKWALTSNISTFLHACGIYFSTAVSNARFIVIKTQLARYDTMHLWLCLGSVQHLISDKEALTLSRLMKVIKIRSLVNFCNN